MSNLKEYQKFVNRGILPATMEREPVVAFALGLVGETGEVVDDIKKRIFHGRDIPLEHTAEEIGDVMWYVANICNVYGFDLEDILAQNMDKLMKRYPEHYTAGDWVDNTDTVIAYRRNGPHIEAYDPRTNKHIKFCKPREVPPITLRLLSELQAAEADINKLYMSDIAVDDDDDIPF